jgi:hypothetical protein
MDRGPLEKQPGFPPQRRPRGESRPREVTEASQSFKGYLYLEAHILLSTFGL